jgi:short subunit dehydrogenase-like uncharacterized protein
MQSRAFDIVLFGATGYTGRLVAEYLGKHAPAGLKWALAGRNAVKLEAVKRELGLASIPIRVADANDRSSLDPLVRDARVVCTTVGPYMKYGRDLVAACADHGAHYCDLTGETPFVRDAIDRCHARAEQTGARIVTCCGFDSIPSDLGVLLLHEEARAPLARVKMLVWRMTGKISGGTAASMVNIVDSAKKDRALRRLLLDPHALDPVRSGDLRGERDQNGVRFDEDLRVWTGPFVMAAINTRVVRRSNALLGHAYGAGLRYGEVMSFGRGPAGWARAALFSAGLGAFVGAATLAPSLVAKVLPAPGEGPSKQERESGSFVLRFVAHTDEPTPRTIGARVAGTNDPGYGETAKMLGESALCLALDEAELPKRAGVLTPATAMGGRLIDRLRAAGMTFAVDDAR